MANQETQKKAYDFLVQRLHDQTEFSKDEVLEATGWKPTTLDAYLSKQLKAYVRRLPDGRLKVKRSFARFGTFSGFQPLVTQVRRQLTQYNRTTYDAVVGYEFLLPLTQEGKLRVALDELFYRDTVEALVRDLADDDALEPAFPAEPSEPREAHIERAIAKIAGLFGGYSISHVNGRFRAAAIASRKDAAQQLVQHELSRR